MLKKLSNADIKSKLYNKERNAKSRGIPFEMSYDKFVEVLHTDRCFFTNEPLSRNKGDHIFSIDRVDSSKGYTDDNVVACSEKINKAKGNLTFAELENIHNAGHGLHGVSFKVVKKMYDAWKGFYDTPTVVTIPTQSDVFVKHTDVQVCQTMIVLSDIHGVPFDLSFRRLKQVMNTTRCFYTGDRLTSDTTKRNSLVVAMIDCDKGYIDSNIVAVAKNVYTFMNGVTNTQIKQINKKLEKLKK